MLDNQHDTILRFYWQFKHDGEWRDTVFSSVIGGFYTEEEAWDDVPMNLGDVRLIRRAQQQVVVGQTRTCGNGDCP